MRNSIFLPPEIIRIVAEFAELKPFMLVCKAFHAVVDDDLIDARANHIDSIYYMYPGYLNESLLIDNIVVSRSLRNYLMSKLQIIKDPLIECARTQSSHILERVPIPIDEYLANCDTFEVDDFLYTADDYYSSNAAVRFRDIKNKSVRWNIDNLSSNTFGK